LPWPKALQYFVEVQKLRHYKQDSDAQRHLAAAQKEIDRFSVSCVISIIYVLSFQLLRQFGTNGVQHHQHNIREDLTTDGIDSEDEDDEDDEDDKDDQDGWDDEDDQDGDEYIECDDETLAQNDPPSSEANSPKRKRTRTAFNIPDEYIKLSTTTSITFQQFDELPIRARSKSIWNQLLLANPQFWMTKCQTWCLQLREAFEVRNEVFLFLHHHLHSVKVNMNNP